LIALSSIGLFNLLNDIYGEICIPEAVFEEVERGGGIDVLFL
jgi:predicted nucleic acid-binding protein